MGYGDSSPSAIGFGCPTTETFHSKDSLNGSRLQTKSLPQRTMLRHSASGLLTPLRLLAHGSVREVPQ